MKSLVNAPTTAGLRDPSSLQAQLLAAQQQARRDKPASGTYAAAVIGSDTPTLPIGAKRPSSTPASKANQPVTVIGAPKSASSKAKAPAPDHSFADYQAAQGAKPARDTQSGQSTPASRGSRGTRDKRAAQDTQSASSQSKPASQAPDASDRDLNEEDEIAMQRPCGNLGNKLNCKMLIQQLLHQLEERLLSLNPLKKKLRRSLRRAKASRRKQAL